MDQLKPGAAIRATLPVPAPLEMPPQVLRSEGGQTSGRACLSRLALAALVVGSTTAFGVNLYAVLSVETPTWMQIVFWIASTLCFAWIAIGAASAIIGFALLVLSRSGAPPADKEVRLSYGTRTALLFPVYSENPHDVATTIEALAADLAADSFDIFVLSDTQDLAFRDIEERIYGRLAYTLTGQVNIFARWRTPNTAKKAGNIRDWIVTYGGGYRYFVILDADSVMTGSTLSALVTAMEAEPQLGLLQTVPRLVGSETVFARAQQFAASYYGPLVAMGIAAWQGDKGNYWGHNAIVRTEAFASAAGLPALPGKPPLGGHILSHDFVEAALLVRAGWRIRLWPSLGGSYEGCPPSLDDLLARDRRWAQGNLQHLKIVGARRLAMMSRLHLALGAWSYLASPIWAATLVVGVALALEGKFANPSYFGTEITLFPKWPVFDAQKALALFVATLIIVHLPKMLGVAWALLSASTRANGGVGRLIAGSLFESILAALIAPVLMTSQTAAVLAVLSGRDAGWAAQRRGGPDNEGLVAYMRRYRWHMSWGVVTAAVCASISWHVLAWMSPVILGLVVSAPMAMLTANSAPSWVARLLATPEDLYPPPILVARDSLRHGPGATASTPARPTSVGVGRGVLSSAGPPKPNKTSMSTKWSPTDK